MRNALVVVAASCVAFSWDAYGLHVFTITGKTSHGLPPFRPPPTSETTPNGTLVPFWNIVEVSGGRTGQLEERRVWVLTNDVSVLRMRILPGRV